MTDDATDPSTLRTRATELEIAAKAIEDHRAREAAALPAATPAAPAAPAPAVPAEVAAVAPAVGPQPPAGKAPLRSLDEWEALPQTERQARMDEADQLQREGHV
jgi:hypothetical protein